MTAPLITDHLFRFVNFGGLPPSGRRTHRVRPRHCCWLGTCDRPEADHITTDEYRRRRDTPGGAP